MIAEPTFSVSRAFAGQRFARSPRDAADADSCGGRLILVLGLGLACGRSSMALGVTSARRPEPAGWAASGFTGSGDADGC